MIHRRVSLLPSDNFSAQFIRDEKYITLSLCQTIAKKFSQCPCLLLRTLTIIQFHYMIFHLFLSPFFASRKVLSFSVHIHLLLSIPNFIFSSFSIVSQIHMHIVHESMCQIYLETQLTTTFMYVFIRMHKCSALLTQNTEGIFTEQTLPSEWL